MRYDIEKIANAIILALDLGVKNLGKTKLMKLLYFADKEHLKQYGRPIFYEKYIKQKMGPVATNTYSILSASKNDPDFKEDIEELSQWIEFEKKDVNKNHQMIVFKKKRDLDEDVFSKSELKVLKNVFEKFKNNLSEEVSAISHKLPEYEQTDMYDVIPYEKMAEDMGDYVKFWNEEIKTFKESIR